MKEQSTRRRCRRRRSANHARRAVAGFALFLLIAAALIARIAVTSGSGAGGELSPRPTPAVVTPAPTPPSRVPVQTSPTRITIPLGNTQDLQIATGVDSFVMVSPEIATGVARNRFTVSITALKIGETMMLATYGTRRQTYIIEVVGKPRGEARGNGLTDADGVPRLPPASTGSFTTTFARGSGGGTSLVRQSLDLRRKLSKGRTLRISGEMFKLFGGATSERAIARVQNLALNRLSVGLDTAEQTIDVLDSQVNISPMSLNSYTMRGFHLVKTPKSDVNAKFPKKGLELYAGLARPSLAFFDTNNGKVAGAMLPVITRDNFQARAGFTAVVADQNRRDASGGVIAQADAIYAATKEISVDGETSFANGDLSWRARLDVKKADYGGSAEITRLARSSPLNSIGAQSGGRKSEQLSFYWQPITRISTSGGYNHAMVTRQINSQSADYNRSLVFVNVSLNISQGSRINLRYSDQKVETAFRGGTPTFDIQTRTFSGGHSIRFNRYLSNTFDARINFNKERNTNEKLETGFNLREQLRLSWKGTSLTGFVNYTSKTPSLTTLIVRDPQILPPLLQPAFALDPVAFLITYRDRLAYLLGGVELPLTRSVDAGVGFQKTFSRFTVSADTRYNAGEIYAVDQKSVSTSAASVAIRLDNANSVSINAWRSSGANTRSGVTISYTHRFGTSGDGFKLSRLFGFGSRKVRGRVYHDLNGNGISDIGEPGVAGMTIQVDGKRQITTGSDGRYEFSGDNGTHRVALISASLGVSLLASTATEQLALVDGRQKLEINFGVRDQGSISGRIYNDLDGQNGGQNADGPGLAGVQITLRPANAGSHGVVLTQVTRSDGAYSFANLRPGKYLVEIDPASVPANFRIPASTGFAVTITPLKTAYHDVPIAAQRALSGVVFIDKDGDGKYNSDTDLAVRNAIVSAGDLSIATDAAGRYLLRNLPARRSSLTVTSQSAVTTFFVELGPEPITRRGFDLLIGTE